MRCAAPADRKQVSMAHVPPSRYAKAATPLPSARRAETRVRRRHSWQPLCDGTWHNAPVRFADAPWGRLPRWPCRACTGSSIAMQDASPTESADLALTPLVPDEQEPGVWRIPVPLSFGAQATNLYLLRGAS